MVAWPKSQGHAVTAWGSKGRWRRRQYGECRPGLATHAHGTKRWPPRPLPHCPLMPPTTRTRGRPLAAHGKELLGRALSIHGGAVHLRAREARGQRGCFGSGEDALRAVAGRLGRGAGGGRQESQGAAAAPTGGSMLCLGLPDPCRAPAAPANTGESPRTGQWRWCFARCAAWREEGRRRRLW